MGDHRPPKPAALQNPPPPSFGANANTGSTSNASINTNTTSNSSSSSASVGHSFLPPPPPGFVYQLKPDPHQPHLMQVHAIPIQRNRPTATVATTTATTTTTMMNAICKPTQQQQHDPNNSSTTNTYDTVLMSTATSAPRNLSEFGPVLSPSQRLNPHADSDHRAAPQPNTIASMLSQPMQYQQATVVAPVADESINVFERPIKLVVPDKDLKSQQSFDCKQIEQFVQFKRPADIVEPTNRSQATFATAAQETPATQRASVILQSNTAPYTAVQRQPSMMLQDEHMPDVSNRALHIKEESPDVITAPNDISNSPASQQQQHQNDGAPDSLDAIAAAADSTQPSYDVHDLPDIIVQQMTPVTSRTAVARLTCQNDVLYLLEAGHVVIGRNSSTSIVHFHVGRSSFISRKHFQVVHDPINQEFFVLIVSKNGIFVDDTFQRRNSVPERLPPVCQFRFPSTEIRIVFESFLAQPDRQFVVPAPVENGPPTLSSAENPFLHVTEGGLDDGGSVAQPMAIAAGPQLQPIHAPPPAVPMAMPQHLQHHQQNTSNTKAGKSGAYKIEKRSPPLSPTGTLSAANSCPTSPQHRFREYTVVATGSGHFQTPAGVGASTSAAAAQQFANNGYVSQQPDPLQQQILQQQHQLDAQLLPPPPAVAPPVSGGLLAPPPPPGHPNEFDKPLFSYAQLIVQSISASPEKQLTLSGIYSFITKHYPYYRREANKGWQNSIRHNLSLNRYFLKVERSQDEPGKGSFWRIDPNSEAKLIDQSYRKRRQRGNQNFRAPYGLPRSAPASPNHMDTSHEASPLHDVLLQSAPGSPDRFQQPQQQQQQQHIQHHNQQHIQVQQQPQNGSATGSSTGGGNQMQIWPE